GGRRVRAVRGVVGLVDAPAAGVGGGQAHRGGTVVAAGAAGRVVTGDRRDRRRVVRGQIRIDHLGVDRLHVAGVVPGPELEGGRAGDRDLGGVAGAGQGRVGPVGGVVRAGDAGSDVGARQRHVHGAGVGGRRARGAVAGDRGDRRAGVGGDGGVADGGQRGAGGRPA